MKTTILKAVPVLPSANLERDVPWYQEKMGFTSVLGDNLYAVLCRENLELHLQWHADTEDDPLLGGSVVRIFVKNIQPLFEEFQQRGTVTADRFRSSTPWNTNEFGFYDLNNNAIFIVEDL